MKLEPDTSGDLSAVIVAKPADEDRVFVGVSLGERGRRAAVIAGIPSANVHVVSKPGDLERVRAAVRGPLVFVRATAQLVMPTLLEKLREARGTSVGTGPRTEGETSPSRQYANVLRVEAERVGELLDALEADFERGDVAMAERILGITPMVTAPDMAIELAPIDCYPLARDDQTAAATTWLFQFVNKPLLDAPATKYIYRPIARPFTKLFVRLPFTPNMITVASFTLGQLGCFIAGYPGYREHLIGIFMMAFVSGILDNVDGEVARLRLQSSKIGAWLDAVGDDLLRLSLLLALGSHVAPHYPDLPIWWMSVASVVLTILTMAPMYWYVVVVVKSPNIQHYGMLVAPSDRPSSIGRSIVDAVVKLGTQVARRDFVDLAVFLLAIVGHPIIAVVAFAIGSVGGVATVISVQLRSFRTRRAAQR